MHNRRGVPFSASPRLVRDSVDCPRSRGVAQGRFSYGGTANTEREVEKAGAALSKVGLPGQRSVDWSGLEGGGSFYSAVNLFLRDRRVSERNFLKRRGGRGPSSHFIGH